MEDLGTFAVGLNPRGVAFDGANIWVTNQGSHTVIKLQPARLVGGDLEKGRFRPLSRSAPYWGQPSAGSG